MKKGHNSRTEQPETSKHQILSMAVTFMRDNRYSSHSRPRRNCRNCFTQNIAVHAAPHLLEAPIHLINGGRVFSKIFCAKSNGKETRKASPSQIEGRQARIAAMASLWDATKLPHTANVSRRDRFISPSVIVVQADHQRMTLQSNLEKMLLQRIYAS